MNVQNIMVLYGGDLCYGEKVGERGESGGCILTKLRRAHEVWVCGADGRKEGTACIQHMIIRLCTDGGNGCLGKRV